MFHLAVVCGRCSSWPTVPPSRSDKPVPRQLGTAGPDMRSMAAPEVPRWRPRRGRSAEGAGLVLYKTSVPSPTTSGFNPKRGKPAGRPHRFIGDKPISAHCVTLPPDPPPSNRGVKWSRARHGQAPCPPPRGRGQPYGYGTCPPLPDADAPPVDGLRRPPWACPAMLKQFPEHRGLAPSSMPAGW